MSDVLGIFPETEDQSDNRLGWIVVVADMNEIA